MFSRVLLAPQVGLEPTTLRLTAACSANWAIEEYDQICTAFLCTLHNLDFVPLTRFLGLHCWRLPCQLSYWGIWPNLHRVFMHFAQFGFCTLNSIFRVALLTLALPTELFRNIWKIRNLFRILQFRQLSIFPGSHPPSIFNVKELNFRVRYGYGWFLFAIVTGFFRVIPSKLNNASSSYDSLPLLFSLS